MFSGCLQDFSIMFSGCSDGSCWPGGIRWCRGIFSIKQGYLLHRNYTFWLDDRLSFSISDIIANESPRKNVVALSFPHYPKQSLVLHYFFAFHFQNYKLFQIKTYIMVPFTSRVPSNLSKPLWDDMMVITWWWLLTRERALWSHIKRISNNVSPFK